jgi:hypothetical protein
MKRLIAALMMILFAGAVSGPVWADTMPAKTPVAKTMKHKKKSSKKGKKAMKPKATPMAK